MSFNLDRRQLLKSSALAAVGGVARIAPAASNGSSAVIDTHIYCGHWPLRSLEVQTPTELAKSLRRASVTQAWVDSFEGLFHKDIHGVNERLTEACRSVENGLFVPVGTVNPTLPDWEEDVARCEKQFRMPGIRLHPTYHDYTLADPKFAQLLRLAASRKMFVQLVSNLPVPESRLLYPRVPRTDLSKFVDIVRPIRGLRLLVTGVRADSNNTRLPDLGPDSFVEVNAGTRVALRS
jgi:hypothetical protein